ncbi:MAG: hypothetical protein H0V40_04775, partial [Actinobacteria bacterium]|nr:hypothetical protein [Actinomycetota bacterium]
MRSLRPVLLLGAAIAVGALVGLVLLTRGDDTAPPAPDSASIAARASIAPRTHLFGDPLVAELELLFDRRRVEPASVRLDAVFEPYEPLDESRSLERSGDLVRLRYRFSLGCFNPACAPSEARREQGLDRARLSYTLADIDRRVVDPVDWPTFAVASRLGPFDVERARWRADSRRLAAVSYRIRPGVLGTGLIGGALLLVLAAG